MLARHAATGVTLRNYKDFRLFDLSGEIAKLPPFDQVDIQADRRTGTHDQPLRSVVHARVSQPLGGF